MSNRLIIGRCAPFLALFLGSTALPVLATPYWIAWEGDDWPENQGWTRDILGGGDARTLEGGMMTLDGLDTGPGFVWDAYNWFRPGSMDPGPDETFVIQWRMRVDAITDGNWDPIVFIYSDDAWAVSLDYAINRVWSSYEGPSAQVQFAPGVFHDYELRSDDMRSYELFIDSSLARVGHFGQAVTPSWMGWGDGSGLERSRSAWDYARFGVVPEGGSLWPAVMLFVAATRVRRTPWSVVSQLRKEMEHEYLLAAVPFCDRSARVDDVQRNGLGGDPVG